jgi:hypothetical protein
VDTRKLATRGALRLSDASLPSSMMDLRLRVMTILAYQSVASYHGPSEVSLSPSPPSDQRLFGKGSESALPNLIVSHGSRGLD